MSNAVALPARSPSTVLADLVPGARVRDVLLVLTGVGMMAASAQVSIPLPGTPVPLTGQTLGVLVTAAALGPVRGLAVQALYLLVGMIGIPVYADATSGVHVILGASGGYILGFLPAAVLIGLAARRRLERGWLTAAPLFVLGQFLVFAVGVSWLAVASDPNLTAAAAIDQGFTPFIIGGLIKAALAGMVLPASWWAVRRLDAED